jgi:hypothetical protein
VADLEFTRTETLSREETAKLLVSLADALSAGNGPARLLSATRQFSCAYPSGCRWRSRWRSTGTRSNSRSS